jgi:flagellar basal body-associated protein FliL
MNSSDPEEDMERFIDKALEEEGRDQGPGSGLGHLEEFSEEYFLEDKAQESSVLDEPQNQGSHPGSDEERAEEEDTEEDTQEINLRLGKKREKRGKRVVAGVAIVLIALLGIGAGYLHVKRERIAGSPNQGTKSQSVSIAIPQEEILTLDSFVIPAEENMDVTYVFLSISIELPNKEVKWEVTEKERSLRGIIYDTLVREIANRKEIPPLERFKEIIARGVNGALSTGRVNQVFIGKFLAL